MIANQVVPAQGQQVVYQQPPQGQQVVYAQPAQGVFFFFSFLF